jgi:hypothetical protein
MWFDLLDHWQSFAAGVLTVGAAFIAGVFALGAAFNAVRAARQQERREVEALRLSLSVEIRGLVDVILQTHKIFDREDRPNSAGGRCSEGNFARAAGRLPKGLCRRMGASHCEPRQSDNVIEMRSCASGAWAAQPDRRGEARLDAQLSAAFEEIGSSPEERCSSPGRENLAKD